VSWPDRAQPRRAPEDEAVQRAWSWCRLGVRRDVGNVGAQQEHVPRLASRGRCSTGNGAMATKKW